MRRVGRLVSAGLFCATWLLGTADAEEDWLLPGEVEAPVAADLAWTVRQTEWSASDERRFETFVVGLGESDCSTVEACLKGPANPYRNSDPVSMSFYADCADFPYLLRAYFAWKNGLPFAYVSRVAPRGATRDIRYSAGGNRALYRRVAVPSEHADLSAAEYFRSIVGTVSTAMYRIAPTSSPVMPADHYPAELSRRGVRPGTVIYDPNGHAAIVYRVDDNGRVHFLDAHPDNSITRGIYGRKFARSHPRHGAGFKNWRPLRLVGARQVPGRGLVGGSVIARPDSEIADFSHVQYFGTGPNRAQSWRAAPFESDGRTWDYYDYLRKALARGPVRFDPIEEVSVMSTGLCEDLRYRVDAVKHATAAGLQHRRQPRRLPRNIYGTSGDWEIYSTPSRDARIKVSFKELRDESARFLELDAAGSDTLGYDGVDLRTDLHNAWLSVATECRISYTRSDGQEQELALLELSRRLFRLSFDPHHCPELRWGAQGSELASCPDGDLKRAWYDAQQRLRNQLDRTYAVRMDFTLQQLRDRASNSGVDEPPEIDMAVLLAARVSATEQSETPPKGNDSVRLAQGVSAGNDVAKTDLQPEVGRNPSDRR